MSTAQELAAELRSIGAALPSARLRHAAGLLERAAVAVRGRTGPGPSDERLTKLVGRLRAAGEEIGLCADRLDEARDRLAAYVTGPLGMSGTPEMSGVPDPRPGARTPDGAPHPPAKE
ncbi:MAG: hypothetical protein GEV11_23965 [Streptosporangiales bacterium]|nr:hypothetical protein [Streptosporangiales bacterium]